MIGSAPKPQHLLPALRRLGLPLGQWYLARWLLLGLLLMSFPACRQRAVTELYVEQMAQRNRALEDLVYDFDAENRSMEFELEDLRRTNAQLQGRLQEIQRQTSRIDTSPSDRPLMIRPESQKPESQKPEPQRPESPKSRSGAPAPLKLPSGRKRDDESLILEPPEIVVPKQATEPILPAPDPLAPKSLAPKSLPPSSLVPEPQVREPQAIDPQILREPSEDLLPELGPPSLKTPELKTPELKIPELKTPEFKTPEFKIPDASLPAVPGIESGSILERAPRGLPSGDSEASLLDRKIQLPASTAPGVGPSGVGPSGTAAPVIQTSAVQALEARGKSGRIPTKPTDSRVREIDWHPTMCRAQNSDGKPGDDGLFLVLIPRNTAGQFVPSLGALTLVVEETLADGSVARIGRYEFSEAELKDYLEPVGSAPGLHIPIRWTEQKPAGTSVEVYAKLTMPDGSTMVNRRTIPLRKTAGMGPSTWTPR
ncbi:MAG: hypothetical protein DWI26_05370 [Planctomycetota bacterium]|nr:MAG: hypothetical protein DWI26_05370 [Planctomycetota bacterium]